MPAVHGLVNSVQKTLWQSKHFRLSSVPFLSLTYLQRKHSQSTAKDNRTGDNKCEKYDMIWWCSVDKKRQSVLGEESYPADLYCALWGGGVRVSGFSGSRKLCRQQTGRKFKIHKDWIIWYCLFSLAIFWYITLGRVSRSPFDCQHRQIGQSTPAVLLIHTRSSDVWTLRVTNK